jgi:adenylosuccinate synthase
MGERKVILVLSGEICTGKSTLAKLLEDRFNFRNCKTKDRLLKIAEKKRKGKSPKRDDFQRLGEELDVKGEGKWVLEYFQELFVKDFAEHKYYVIDAARISQQIMHIRDAYSYFVYHIHLEASPESLKQRFLQRGEIQSLPPKEQLERYAQYKNDETERKVNDLRGEADLIINTDKSNSEDVFIRAASFFKLFPPTNTELVDVIIGGQFGSEGKGQIAAHISPEYDCLMRVGGPNAGHTVFERPYNHVFHLLPSGTHRASNAKLLIGPGAVLNLDKILEEIRFFGIEKDRLIIDENAIIISEEDIAEEQKIKDTISSTGQGVGVATSKNIIARLYNDDTHKAKHFSQLRGYLGSTSEELELLYSKKKKILLEGTQGTGLSLQHGLYPHVTSRDTSVSGCLSEAGISPKRVGKIIMVTRTYPIRVGGSSGPFLSTELTFKDISDRSGIPFEELEKKEITTTTKKPRRVAEFSWSLFRKACELNSPTDIALTFVDYFNISNKSARRFESLTEETKRFIDEIERCSGVKVSLIGTTFDYRAVIDRRNW